MMQLSRGMRFSASLDTWMNPEKIGNVEASTLDRVKLTVIVWDWPGPKVKIV
jgi:hypothetical protein